MYKKRRRACGRQCRGKLARDVAGFSDAGDDDATATAEQYARSGKKGAAKAALKRADRGRLGREHIATERKRALRVDAARGRNGLGGL